MVIGSLVLRLATVSLPPVARDYYLAEAFPVQAEKGCTDNKPPIQAFYRGTRRGTRQFRP